MPNSANAANASQAAEVVGQSSDPSCNHCQHRVITAMRAHSPSSTLTARAEHGEIDPVYFMPSDDGRWWEPIMPREVFQAARTVA